MSLVDDSHPAFEKEWESDLDAYEWYNDYALRSGFSVRKGFVNSKDDVVTSRGFLCSKEGYRKKKDPSEPRKGKYYRKETRCGCLSRMYIRRYANGRFKAFEFYDLHNHELVESPYAHMGRSHRKITEAQAISLSLADDAGIRSKLNHELQFRQAGGRDSLGYLQTDLNNHLATKRKEELARGIDGAILDYFGRSTEDNPTFFFRIQLDCKSRITNIFWADEEMKLDYEVFGDVIFFDTTYRTNKEYRPFGAFIGINNHGSQVVFGAFLLYDETAATFCWLFKTFFECMGEAKPRTIFTDRDMAMANAIALVMPEPETRHRLCIWHILQNAATNLSQFYSSRKSSGEKRSPFKIAFDRCLYEGDCEAEFNMYWKSLLDDHDLHENTWLKELHKTRHKWAMSLGRTTFCAGKKTTQMSESFHARIKHYLRSDQNLSDFFKHFERVIDDLRYNESKSNFSMITKKYNVTLKFPLVQHAAEIYTEKLFHMFEAEYQKSGWVQFEFEMVENGIGICKAHECTSSSLHVCSEAKKYTITLENDMLRCSCKYLDFMGLPCGHVLKLLVSNPNTVLMHIPPAYILPRWTKNAKKVHPSYARKEVPNEKLEGAANYRYLSHGYHGIIAEYAMYGPASKILYECLENLRKKLRDCVENEPFNKDGEENPKDDNDSHGQWFMIDGKPVYVNGLKKRPVQKRNNAKRIKSSLELGKRRKKSCTTTVNNPSALGKDGNKDCFVGDRRNDNS